MLVVLWSCLLSDAYFAGKIIVNGTEIGGAVGESGYSNVQDVFWDSQLSGLATSAAGTAETTNTLKQQSFWQSQGFDQHLWILTNGLYPRLFSDS